MPADLKEIETSVGEDGKVDANEVANIRAAFLADGKIDRTEADALFRINDAVTNGDNDPAWATLFSELVAAHVLEDDSSPNVVSDEEAAYLKEKIGGDGSVDAAERALLTLLKSKVQSPVPADLQGLFDSNL